MASTAESYGTSEGSNGWCAVSVPCASRHYAPKWAFLIPVRLLPCGLILEVSA
jgi:hypothetical protein